MMCNWLRFVCPTRPLKVALCTVVLGALVIASTHASSQGTPGFTPNFDAVTQALIDHADRIIFMIPFSHWDTDWHDTFANYSRLADRNILEAIQLAKQYPRF